MDTPPKRDSNPVLLKKSYTAFLAAVDDRAGAKPLPDSRPPRPAASLANVPSDRLASMSAASTGGGDSRAPSAKAQLARASSASAIRGLRSQSPADGERTVSYLPSSPTDRFNAFASHVSAYTERSEEVKVSTMLSPAKRVTDTRPFSAAVASPSPQRSVTMPSPGRKVGHVAMVHHLSASRDAVAASGPHGGTTIARFLNPTELQVADIDKGQLVQEWLSSFAMEDQHFNSAVLSAEVKMRYVVAGRSSRAVCGCGVLQAGVEQACGNGRLPLTTAQQPRDTTAAVPLRPPPVSCAGVLRSSVRIVICRRRS